jgi:hypothetical protein
MSDFYLYWSLFEFEDVFEPRSSDLQEDDYISSEDEYTIDFLKGPGIYQIYGYHPTHGPETLLYIGRSLEILGRLWRHLNHSDSEIYLKDEQDVRFRVGRVYEDRSSERYKGINDINEEELENIEGLLIYASSPVYNTQSTQTVDLNMDVKIFNDGDYGPIPGELSTDYYRWGTKYDK